MWVRTGTQHSCWLPSQTAVTLQQESKLTTQHLPAALTANWCRQRLAAFVVTPACELAQMLASKLARLGESIVQPDRSMQGVHEHDPP